MAKAKKQKGVYIVGAAIDPEIRFLDGFEIWSVNNLFNIELPRRDRWFELHSFSRKKGVWTRRTVTDYGGVSVKDYLKRLDGLGCPVYMQRQNRLVKKSVVYPFEEITEKFGEYFGCSFAWMTALAIFEGYTDIFYRGVALAGKEYFYQRPSTEYLMGLARGRGVRVVSCADSRLLKEPYIYAWREDHGLINTLYGKHNDSILVTALAAIQEMTCRLHYEDSNAQ